MQQIDLNCDMGESFGAYTLGMDAAVIEKISSANIACGFHAGDPMVLARTVQLAAEKGVGIGAHPGYPDLVGFGRRNMECSLEEVRNYIVYQIGAISAFCTAHGARLQHVKPHGALYNAIVGNPELVRTVAEAIASVDPGLLFVSLAGPHADRVQTACRAAGIRPVFEAFPDRAYTSDGRLQTRRAPGAVIHDPLVVAERALRMVTEQQVVAVDGTVVPLDAQTLCVHGDTPSALNLVRQIHAAMTAAGIAVAPMATLFPRQRTFTRAHFRVSGDRGLLCEYGDGIDLGVNRVVRAMAEGLQREPPRGLLSVVPAYRSLGLTYDPATISLEALKMQITRLEERLGDDPLATSRVVEIPVCYGGESGPDLAFVAEHNGLSEAEVIDLHTRPEYPIYMIGFAPGFCYLGGLNERLHTPRLETPRALVAAGSVGIANDQTGMYPLDSPGGWRLIGRTPLRLFKPASDTPFLYQPGDRIRFRPIDVDEYNRLQARENS